MSKSLPVTIGLLLVLSLGLGWWILAAVPSQSEIQAARTTLPDVPSPDLSVLTDRDFTSRSVPAGLPVEVNPDGFGRSDPYAAGSS